MEASETITRQVATGEVTVTPPPAEATMVAGGATMPRPVAGSRPLAAPARRAIPWGWIMGGARIGVSGLVAVVSSSVRCSGRMGRSLAGNPLPYPGKLMSV